MFDLVERVLVATCTDGVKVDLLQKKLHEIGLLSHCIKSPEWSNERLDPIIFCSTTADVDPLKPQLKTDADQAYMVWSCERPSQGKLLISNADNHGEPEILELSFTDCVCALIQCYLQRNTALTKTNPAYWQANMIGRSPAFAQMLKLVTKISKIDYDVLIQGETGTGKELVARSIHYQSDRQDYPFVPINCGAFSDDLLLSELFGHTKGAFTGANSDRTGLIEQAENGTLFLDEIDSLSSKAQVAILRYLQDREIRPQGSNELRKCNTRVLAASNKSVKELVKRDQFREDLLFRLDVLHIDLPPLRERENDVHLLAQSFVNKACNEYNRQHRVFSPNMMLTLVEYHWPGNIRQLQNIVYRLCLLSDQFIIRTDFAAKLAGVDWKDYLPKTGRQTALSSMKEEKQRVIELFESAYLKEMLSETSGNISEAARLAKKERSSFIRLMKKYKINRQDFLQADSMNLNNDDIHGLC